MRTRESSIADRNVCTDVIQGIFFPSGEVNTLMKTLLASLEITLKTSCSLKWSFKTDMLTMALFSGTAADLHCMFLLYFFIGQSMSCQIWWHHCFKGLDTPNQHHRTSRKTVACVSAKKLHLNTW